ncbi:MAG: FKBP-type peptidyl-prolyl cis-trans isomerase [Ferruginibacter sp.]
MKKLFVCLLAFGSTIGYVQAQVKGTAAKTPVKAATKQPGKTAVSEKPVMKSLLDSFSYAAGVNIANNMKQQGIENINTALMAKAVEDVFKSQTMVLSPEQCSNVLQDQMNIFNKKKDEGAKKQTDAEKAKGQAFLANNKTRKEITTLPDGLQYEILEPGEANGAKPTAQDTVVMDYKGSLIDGTVFDESKGKPITYPVTGFIQGWIEVLQLMPKGAKWKVYIPSELAYGDRGTGGGSIPGGATLIFEMTLHDIKPATTK